MKVFGRELTFNHQLVRKEAAVPFRLGYGGVSYETPNPTGVTDEELLRCYANDPWLYAVIDCITQGESAVKWHVNKVNADGEKEEITDKNHELKRLLNRPNDLQTGEDLWEIGETYSLLTGRDFWRLSREKGKWELNIVPSAWMRPIMDKRNIELIGWHYERGTYKRDFPAAEIIPFIHPNPLSPLDGISATHSISIDLSIHNYARLFNRYFFYNNAEAGVILTTEASDQTEIDRMKEKYKAEHRGYGRAFNIDIFSGVTQVLQSEAKHKDMHFNELMEYERKLMLAAFRIPYTLLGGTDMVQRGNADAALYHFAKNVLHPRLEFRKRKLNEYLVPVFGKDLELDYDDPTPEDRLALVNEAMQGWNAGLFTRDQSLKILKYEPCEDEAIGSEYKQQASSMFGDFSGFGKDGKDEEDKKKEEKEKEEQDKDKEKAVHSDPKVKSIFEDEESKELHWKLWVKQAESFEPKFIETMQGVFEQTRKEVESNLHTGITRDTKLFNMSRFVANYTKELTPIMFEVMASAVLNGRKLVEPSNPHKADIPKVLNQFALAWLKTRINWTALEVGNETEKLLRKILIEGFRENTGLVADLVRRIMGIPGFADRTRARMIARTEIISAHSQGTLEGYRDSGFVRKVQFYAADDERSCDYCMTFHNKTFNLGDQIPIPLHPNCRCVWLPVVEI